MSFLSLACTHTHPHTVALRFVLAQLKHLRARRVWMNTHTHTCNQPILFFDPSLYSKNFMYQSYQNTLIRLYIPWWYIYVRNKGQYYTLCPTLRCVRACVWASAQSTIHVCVFDHGRWMSSPWTPSASALLSALLQSTTNHQILGQTLTCVQIK